MVELVPKGKASGEEYISQMMVTADTITHFVSMHKRKPYLRKYIEIILHTLCQCVAYSKQIIALFKSQNVYNIYIYIYIV